MTADEKLDLILSRLDNIDNKVDNLENRFDNLENRFDNLENRFDKLENRFDNLENRFDNLENRFNNLEDRFDKLENKVNSLEKEVKYNSLITETTVNKCIQVLGEGYRLNAERFDRLDMDSIRTKTDQAVMLSKLVSEKVDKLTEKLNQSA